PTCLTCPTRPTCRASRLVLDRSHYLEGHDVIREAVGIASDSRIVAHLIFLEDFGGDFFVEYAVVDLRAQELQVVFVDAFYDRSRESDDVMHKPRVIVVVAL